MVLFNGQFFPEATARWVASQRGIRTITHEVGLQPFSAFFTTGEATAYPLHVPDDFELSDAQNERLDAYLSQRFHGQFSMAGVRFWPEMKGLDASFLQKAASFQADCACLYQRHLRYQPAALQCCLSRTCLPGWTWCWRSPVTTRYLIRRPCPSR